MPHIKLNENLLGMRALLEFSPKTAHPINELAEILLREDNTLSRGDRELIGTYVSYLNNCFFCQNVHGSLAQFYMQCDMKFIDDIKTDYEKMPLPYKMKALLAIAASVQRGGKNVTHDQIEKAKIEGATDKEIHDTVLIAAFFCMCNRYVDGLNTTSNPDRQFYIERSETRANEGYRDFDLHK
jgi:uncharacterized peroxidase-related enzyme